MRVSELIERLEQGPVRSQIERLQRFVQASIPQNFEHKWPGYLVHGFTASGAALAFLALVRRWPAMPPSALSGSASP